MAKNNLLEEIYKIENQLIREEQTHPLSYIILQGKNSVCVSAPHSVKHWRSEKEKIGEYVTGAIATILHESKSCHAMMKTKFEKNDPNFDPSHPYKDDLIAKIKENRIKYLLDLHIMADFRKPEIEIGTGKGRNIQQNEVLPALLKKTFEKHGIQPVIVDEHFTGGYPHTVSSTVARAAGIPCIQVELNWRIINQQSKSNKILQVIRAFEEYISFLETGEWHD